MVDLTFRNIHRLFVLSFEDGENDFQDIFFDTYCILLQFFHNFERIKSSILISELTKFFLFYKKCLMLFVQDISNYSNIKDTKPVY